MWLLLCIHIYACIYTCIYITEIYVHIFTRRACESLRGKATAFLKYILFELTVTLSDRVSYYGWDCPVAATAFVRLLLALRSLAQLVIHWIPQRRRLHCYTGMQPGARSDSCQWLWAAVAQEELCTLELIGEVGWGKNCFSCTVSLSGNVSQGRWPCLLPSFHNSERMQQQVLLQEVFLYFTRHS